MACYSCSRTSQTSGLLQLFQNWPNQWPVTVVPEVAKAVACYSCSGSGQTSGLLQLFQKWPKQWPVTVVPEVAKAVACYSCSRSGQSSGLLQLFQKWPKQCPVSSVQTQNQARIIRLGRRKETRRHRFFTAGSSSLLISQWIAYFINFSSSFASPED